MPPGSARLLDSSGHVHALAVESAVRNDHVPEVDTDAKLHAPVDRQLGIADPQLLLDLDRASDRRRDGGERRQQAISRDVDQPAAVSRDDRANHGLIGRQPPDGFFDAVGDQAAVASDVSVEAGDESTRHRGLSCASLGTARGTWNVLTGLLRSPRGRSEPLLPWALGHPQRPAIYARRPSKSDATMNRLKDKAFREVIAPAYR
jgi:hypothetical protein